MGIAASPYLNPAAETPDGAGRKRTAEALSRRARQRRQIQGMIGFSYVVDAVILLVYAHAGTVPVTVGPAFAICGLVSGDTIYGTGYLQVKAARFDGLYRHKEKTYFIIRAPTAKPK